MHISSLTWFLDIYDDTFFEGIDGVTNALDNVKARKLSTPKLVEHAVTIEL